MRSKGNLRPLSIFEVRTQVRSKVSRLTEKTMLGMLSPQGVYQLFLITCSIHLVHVHENNYQLYYSTNIFLVDLNGCVKAEIFNPSHW